MFGSIAILNRNSERIHRSLLRGERANQNQIEFLTVEDTSRLAARHLQLVNHRTRTHLKIKVRVSGKAQDSEKADHTCSI